MTKSKKVVSKIAYIAKELKEAHDFLGRIGKKGWSVSLSVCDDNDCSTISVNNTDAKLFVKDQILGLEIELDNLASQISS